MVRHKEPKLSHENYYWLLTIKHSGTRYTMEVLSQLQIQVGNFNHADKRASGAPGVFIQLHLCEPSHHALKAPAGNKIIMTLRNPIDVYRTWKARGRNGPGVKDKIIEAFTIFDSALNRFQAHLFKVDGNIEFEIDTLAAYLGVTRLPVNLTQEHKHSSGKVYDGTVPIEIMELSRQYGY